MLSLLLVALILYRRNHYSFSLVQESFAWRIYNPRHNILALFKNVAQVLITTNKAILDISITNLVQELPNDLRLSIFLGNIRNYKLRNIRKMSNVDGDAA